MSRIVFDHVSKAYAGPRGEVITAVKDLSLRLAAGEFLVLVGPSGSGKTTTLRLLAGLESVSAGTIAIDDRVVNDLEPHARDVAMVFQQAALYPHLNVFENLAFGLRLRRAPAAEVETRVRGAADQLGLTPLLDRDPATLSGGERQRVAVGRALVRPPRVFLFDEPLSNLDATLRAQLRLEFQRLHARLGTTTVYVTHDQTEALALGGRIAVLRGGALQQVGTPVEVYRRPANLFVAGFVGLPPMNLLPGRLISVGGQLAFAADPAALGVTSRPSPWPVPAEAAAILAPWRDKAVVLGFRAEHGRPAVQSGSPGTVPFRVELSEFLGAETLLYGRVGATPVTWRWSAGSPPQAGGELTMQIDLAAASFFDPASGRAIG